MNEEFWTDWILESLEFEGQPIAITRLVNLAATWGNFSKRPKREAKKIELFRLIGRLIKSGTICRVARKYVSLPPKADLPRGILLHVAHHCLWGYVFIFSHNNS